MAGKDIIIMSMKELSRLSVIGKAIEKQITQKEAAEILDLCTRQIRRIVAKVKLEGDEALIHKSRGKPSNRARQQKIRNRILHLCKREYKGFGPTFAAEKLFEINKIKIHPDTLRKWFIEAVIEYSRRKNRKHRSWRPRKECFGQMTQIDGSHEDWFEARGDKCVYMGYIDDATNKVFGRFYEYEGTMPFMDSFKRYAKKHGLPQRVYFDNHSTYKSNRKLTVEEQLDNKKAQSQVERALNELGVEYIHAASPQAKGRIERSFRTHQDRLIKEMRLVGISNIKDANKFLSSYYIPKHNRKFSIPAKNNTNLHRPIPKGLNLDKILCERTEAALRSDFTVRYDKKLFQVLDNTPAKKLTVEERLNNKLYISYKGKELKYKLINIKPIPEKKVYKPRKIYIPPKDHPYKLLFKKLKRKCA